MKNVKHLLLKSFLILFIGFVSNNLFAKDRTLRIQVEGVKYDSLIIYGTNSDGKLIKKHGKQTAQNLWTFSISEYEFNTLYWYQIIPKSFDTRTKTARSSDFYLVNGKDTLSADWLHFYENMPVLKLKYFAKEIKTNEDLYVNNIGLVKDCQRITHKFLLNSDTTSDNYVAMKYRYFGTFDTADSIKLKYQDYLNEYIAIAKSHPESKFFITQIWRLYSRFKSKEDLKKVYDVFNDKVKNSYIGMRIGKYLTFNRFANMELPNEKTGISEPIIEDSSKYTLVIFSASWCGPCHRLIPTLKEAYSDLKDKVNFVYVSVDEKETVQNWKKIISEKEIPWRSLLASNDVLGVRHKYFVEGIPELYLVAPGGKLEEIPLYEKEGKDKLYKLVQNK